MNDKRQLQRWRLIYYLRVFEGDGDRLLGHVVDISVEGLMLIGTRPMESGRELALTMEIPDENGERTRVKLRARSQWSRPDVNRDFHDTGLRLVDPDADTVARIQALIEDLRFPGPGALPENIFGFGQTQADLA